MIQEIINNLKRKIQTILKKRNWEKEKKIAEDFENSRYKSYQIQWKRISEFIHNAELFPNELHCDCFSQNLIGDCYFIDMIY